MREEPLNRGRNASEVVRVGDTVRRARDRSGYMAWTWCIQADGNVPIDAQAARLRELRDAYGPHRQGH